MPFDPIVVLVSERGHVGDVDGVAGGEIRDQVGRRVGDGEGDDRRVAAPNMMARCGAGGVRRAQDERCPSPS